MSEKANQAEVLNGLFDTDPIKKALGTMAFSTPVVEVTRIVKELKGSKELLSDYRELQHLQLTSIQLQILEAITPDKIEAASISELVNAYKILKDKELVSLGKATQITGLVGYLVELEKQQQIAAKTITVSDSYEDAEEVELINFDMPKL